MNRIRKLLMNKATGLKMYIEYPEVIKAKRLGINHNTVMNLIDIERKFNIKPRTIYDIGAAVGEWSIAANYV